MGNVTVGSAVPASGLEILRGRGRINGTGKWSAIFRRFCDPASDQYLQPGMAVPIEYAPEEGEDEEKLHKAFLSAFTTHTFNWLGSPMFRNHSSSAFILQGEFAVRRASGGGSILARNTDEEYQRLKEMAFHRHSKRAAAGLTTRGMPLDRDPDGTVASPELLAALRKAKRGQNPQEVMAKAAAKAAAVSAPTAPAPAVNPPAAPPVKPKTPPKPPVKKK